MITQAAGSDESQNVARIRAAWITKESLCLQEYSYQGEILKATPFEPRKTLRDTHSQSVKQKRETNERKTRRELPRHKKDSWRVRKDLQVCKHSVTVVASIR